MDRGFNYQSVRNGAKVSAAALALMLGVSLPAPLAYAQGQTEVAKTVPSNPQQAAGAEAATNPQQPNQPVSPIGAGGNWQANVAIETPAPPVQPDDMELVQKVNDYFNGLTNLSGTFVQTDPDTKQKRGKFVMERPGKVRFDYGSPSKLKIISDGKYLAIEDHDLNTADRYPLEMTPFRLLLTEKVDLANDAKIVSVEQGPEIFVLTLEDKKGDTPGRIRLFFNKADMTLKEWIITDAQGLDTRIEIANVEQNKQLAENLFEFSKTIGFKTSN